MDAFDIAKRSADAMMAGDACSKALGIEIEVQAPGDVVATMIVRDDMVNGHDVCHGGIVFTLADTAFAFACNAYNRQTLSVAANIEWLRPVLKGDVLTAHATEVNVTGRHGYYNVKVTKGDKEVVALFRGHSVSRDQQLFDR